MVRIIGHRGARGLYPENSLLGFMNVLKSGIEIIELDIVFSKDGIPIITHDQDISPFFCRDSKGEFIKDKKKFQLLTPKNFTHMILVGLILKRNMESIFQSNPIRWCISVISAGIIKFSAAS